MQAFTESGAVCAGDFDRERGAFVAYRTRSRRRARRHPVRTALLVLIAGGGVLYTLGAWFYARQGFRYHHMVWHLLINLAVVAHFIGIVFFLY